MKKWIAFALLFAVLLFGSVFGFNMFKQQKIAEFMAARPVPSLPVEVQQATVRDWTPSIKSIGFIEPFQGVTVSSSVAGLVDKIHFQSGDKVKADDLLVELEAKVEKANLASAQARLPALKRQLTRNRTLLGKGSVSQTQFDDSEAQYLSLVNDVVALQETIKRKQIRAPFDGIVGIRQINLGEYLQPGNDIVRLENLDKMQIRFIVPQKQLSQIYIDMPIELHTDAYPDTNFVGAISAIEPTVDFQSGVVQIQAEIPNSNQQLRSGMYADVVAWLPVLKDRVVIPQIAVNFTLYGQSVFVVEESQNQASGETELHVKQRSVVIDERLDDDVLIASGVEGHEKVVVAGQVRLQNGAKVRLVEDSFIDRKQELPNE
ncbi:efflux RND transporter periplasmic adaptor subunit [Alginatibacterium sediminis]|uniref:Efflux RND transporter periplasmic adaptor subunit n=1 Tax=Alginatibacterium sediminis TaxID=2164068 RepID=A0A420ELI6_9ALTE|nr:efflux RND transporter periplasmic adaptor subunit [Alginatibacterium sediminis]RKF21549.1 efflux RND transporter periplasmic adaptor subunit [Alginatibacterium sediminis]